MSSGITQIAGSTDSSNNISITALYTYPDGSTDTKTYSFSSAQYNLLVWYAARRARPSQLANTIPDPILAPTLTSGSGSLVAGPYSVVYSFVSGSGETGQSLQSSVTLGGTGGVTTQIIELPAASTTTIKYYMSTVSGGTLSAATYGYRVTSKNAIGETMAATGVTVTPASGTTNISIISWNAIAGATSYNVYGRTAGSELLIANVVALATPVISSTSTATTGGTLVPATYGYRVSALYGNSETLASVEATQVVPAGTSTNTVTVNWSAITGATGYTVYGRTAAGELKLATTSALTYTDTGSALPVGALPTANTTGLSYNDLGTITPFGALPGSNTTAMANAAAPTCTVVGTTGATTRYYQIIKKCAAGATAGYTGTPPGTGVGSVTTGNATLSSSNFDLISWPSDSTATSYDVLTWNGSVWVLLANTTGLDYANKGDATAAYTVPSSNTSAITAPGGSAVTSTIPLGYVTSQAYSGSGLPANVTLGGPGAGATPLTYSTLITVADVARFAGIYLLLSTYLGPAAVVGSPTPFSAANVTGP